MGIEYRVFGCPGTGKTTYLSKQIELAVQKHGSDSVLVSSFTRAAATELTRRKLPIDESQIGTLHAHCYRAIGNPDVVNSHLKEWNKDFAALALSDEFQSSIDEPFNDNLTTKTEGDELYSQVQILRAKIVDHSLWPTRVQFFNRKWTEWKDSHNYVDFTDLIERAIEDTFYAPGSPTIGFFDEVQDFTPLELKLVRRWAGQMSQVVMAGDDDQCIYSFKGATPQAFLEPELPREQVKVLPKSYRLPSEIYKYAEKWIRKLSYRQPKQYQPMREGGSVRHDFDSDYAEPSGLVREAERLIDQGKTVMIIGACSYMLKNTITLLRQSGIPFHNPYRKARGDWNPLGAKKGVTTKERLMAYLHPYESAWGEDAAMWTGSDLKKWVSVLDSKIALLRGAKKLVDGMEDDSEIPVSTLTTIFNEESLKAFLSTNENLESCLDRFSRCILKSKLQPFRFPMSVVKRKGGSALMDEPKICIGTIHSVKGAEADVVFIFPDLSRSGYGEWQGTREQKDSIIRQYYVGLTRAKQDVIFCRALGVLNVFS